MQEYFVYFKSNEHSMTKKDQLLRRVDGFQAGSLQQVIFAGFALPLSHQMSGSLKG